jgi:hypothetical protein
MNINNLARDILAATSASHQQQHPIVKASSSIRAEFLDATIYVADLPLTVTYKDLTEVFERQIGLC